MSLIRDGQVEVAITPTYSGCPAMNMIGLEIELALEREGFRNSKVRTVLSPAWTTDWMSEDGRRKLREYGIAPPQAAGSRRALFGVQQVACPQCGSGDTEVLSEFGSTSCKALWRCKSCREPFDYFKCHLTVTRHCERSEAIQLASQEERSSDLLRPSLLAMTVDSG